MQKLIILKSLVDFIWIVTCIPMIGLLLFFSVYIFIDTDMFDVVFNANTTDDAQPQWLKQIVSLVYIVIVLISIYCLFIFRRTLRYFQKVKPFHIDVIQNFNKMGYLLILVGLSGTIITVVTRLVFNGQFKVSLGLTPHLILVCLGLFFMVLSEVFKVAKHAKEENDLTV